MLFSSFFKSFSNEYNVDVFPLPVGPVTNNIPYGFVVISSNIFISLSVSPKFTFERSNAVLSRILITKFSPFIEGNIDTLKSISFPSISDKILPSWGILLSEISIPLNSLILVTMEFKGSLGASNCFLSLPSILYLITILFFCGSICISLTLFLTAFSIILSISFTAGDEFSSFISSSSSLISLIFSSSLSLAAAFSMKSLE